VALPVAKLPMA